MTRHSDLEHPSKFTVNKYTMFRSRVIALQLVGTRNSLYKLFEELLPSTSVISEC